VFKNECEFIAQFNVSPHTAKTTPTGEWQAVYSIRSLLSNNFYSEKVNPFAIFGDKNYGPQKENQQEITNRKLNIPPNSVVFARQSDKYN
jgi:hypothetical protein